MHTANILQLIKKSISPFVPLPLLPPGGSVLKEQNKYLAPLIGIKGDSYILKLPAIVCLPSEETSKTLPDYIGEMHGRHGRNYHLQAEKSPKLD